MSLNPSQIASVASQMSSLGANVSYSPGSGVDPSTINPNNPSSKPIKSGGSMTVQTPLDMALAMAYLNGELAPEYETVLDYNFGWNTRATLVESITPGTIVRFRIPAYSAGVVVGLTRGPAAAGIGDIEFGIYQSKASGAVLADDSSTSLTASIQIIRNGSVYTPQYPEVSEADESMLELMATDGLPADLFPLPLDFEATAHELRVYGDRVEYWTAVVGEFGTSHVHRYTAPLLMANWSLSAALYGGGDKVWDLSVQAGSNAFMRLPVIGVFGTDVADYSGGTSELPAMVMSGEDYIEAASGDMVIPSIQMIGGDDVALGSIMLPTVSMSGLADSEDLPVVDITFGNVRLPRVSAQGLANTEEAWSADMVMPSVAVFGSDVADLTVGRPVLPVPVRIMANDTDDLRRVLMVEFAYVPNVIAGFEWAYVVWSERYGFVGIYTPAEIETARIQATLNATSSITANEILQALIAASMSAADTAALTSEPLQVWAFHLDAGGSTRYESYDFNSFCTIGGITYGANETGIYRLDGNDDDGTAIQSSVDFGSLSFGTSARKSVPYVYVGMASDGTTFLKVECDDQTYLYEARDSTEYMKAHRFELGRGLRGSFYGFTLVSEGSAFDLHSIEFFPVALQRRL